MTEIKDMRRALGFLPLLEQVEMPLEAISFAPSAGDMVGRMDTSFGSDFKTVNLYCKYWYWSKEYACIFIPTYYNCPWDKRKKDGKLIKGWSLQ